MTLTNFLNTRNGRSSDPTSTTFSKIMCNCYFLLKITIIILTFCFVFSTVQECGIRCNLDFNLCSAFQFVNGSCSTTLVWNLKQVAISVFMSPSHYLLQWQIKRLTALISTDLQLWIIKQS